VTLSNPHKLNALDLAMWTNLGEVMRELDRDKSLRCVVMRGAGNEASPRARTSPSSKDRNNSRVARKYASSSKDMDAIGGCRHP